MEINKRSLLNIIELIFHVACQYLLWNVCLSVHNSYTLVNGFKSNFKLYSVYGSDFCFKFPIFFCLIHLDYDNLYTRKLSYPLTYPCVSLRYQNCTENRVCTKHTRVPRTSYNGVQPCPNFNHQLMANKYTP